MKKPRRGATLIELLVALILLDLALLSLATMGAAAAKRVGDAGRRSRAAVAAMNRLERLGARPCASVSGGSVRLEPGVQESWSAQRFAAVAEVSDSMEILSRPAEQFVVRARVPCG
jgi:Tfp pilus assembly protein PilV